MPGIMWILPYQTSHSCNGFVVLAKSIAKKGYQTNGVVIMQCCSQKRKKKKKAMSAGI